MGGAPAPLLGDANSADGQFPTAATDSDGQASEEPDAPDAPTPAISFAQTLALGTAAGFVAECTLYPLEGGLARHRHAGVLDLKAVGADLRLLLARKAPATGLLVASYEVVRQELKRRGVVPTEAASAWGYLAHGAAAATIAQILETAVWAPISNMQIERDRLILASAASPSGGPARVPSTPRLILSTLLARGPGPLYKGSFGNFLATFPTVSLYYGISDALVQAAKRRTRTDAASESGDSELGMGTLAGIGAASSFLAVLLATPIEFLRAKMAGAMAPMPVATTTSTQPTDVLQKATKTSARKAVFSLFRNSVRNALTKAGRRDLVRMLARNIAKNPAPLRRAFADGVRRVLRNPAPLRKMLTDGLRRIVRSVVSRGKAK